MFHGTTLVDTHGCRALHDTLWICAEDYFKMTIKKRNIKVDFENPFI